MFRALQSVPRALAKRSFAAAAPASTPAHDPDQLLLNFSTPDKAIYSNKVVKQVDIPTYAGTVGILAKHVPTIGVLKPGVVTVTDAEGGQTRHFVSSGSMAMNIDGSLQVLAEETVKLEEIDEALVRQEMDAAQRKSTEGGSEVDKAEALIRVEVCEQLLKALAGQH